MTVRSFSKPVDTPPSPRSRVVRFLGAGVINTAFGYSVFAALVFLGAHPQVALIVQFVIGVIWNYWIHGRYVFGVRGYARLPLYALSYVIIYFANAFLLRAFMVAGLNAYLAQAVALGPVVILSYVMISHALGVRPGAKGDERL
ncbi:MAG: GtrA family protein [Ruegeria sp.]|uniref:GtrA family protein n=1 Tax=Ruegeria sp. TaxID=1879320 RepID=UPI00349E5C7C